MLNPLHIDLLQKGRSLLAFSGGVDSTALFHLLHEHHILFDVAHVNYHTRSTSDLEAQQVQSLALEHKQICHIHSCTLPSENFEFFAREERYHFFTTLCQKHGYQYLITAHQLNDRFEWLLMQFSKGGGLPEILGMRSLEKRNTIEIIRPLLNTDRGSIEAYLNHHDFSYFIDESNQDESYRRNYIRHQFSNRFLEENRLGVEKSFQFLEEDLNILIESTPFQNVGEFYFSKLSKNHRSTLLSIDKHLKSLGYLLKQSEKEYLKHENSMIVGRKWVIVIDEIYVFLTPYIRTVTLEKAFKEKCRKLKIHPKLRGYLSLNLDAFVVISQLKDETGLLQFD